MHRMAEPPDKILPPPIHQNIAIKAKHRLAICNHSPLRHLVGNSAEFVITAPMRHQSGI